MPDLKDTGPPSPPAPPAEGDAERSLSGMEPPLTEVLTDPIVHTLLDGDGIPLASLRSLIGETRQRLGATRRQRAERRKNEPQSENDGGSDPSSGVGTSPRRRRDDLSSDPVS